MKVVVSPARANTAMAVLLALLTSVILVQQKLVPNVKKVNR